MKWISTSDKLPEELETVWAYNQKDNFIALACYAYENGGWLWAVSNGIMYIEKGKIVSECELDDDYHFDYWMPLPELPKTAQ